MKVAPLLALAATAALGACSGDDEPRPERSAPAQSREQPAAAVRELGSIVVPEADPTPPLPIVRLGGVRATLDRGVPRVLVPRDEPISVMVVGRDPDGGMGRARVAIRARLTCRSASGEVAIRPLVRYVPPPQIERVRIVPGTRTRTELRRTVRHRFDSAECMGGVLERFSGQAWADITNASGLDATSRHIHFASR